MSELVLSSPELKNWLESQTNSVFVPIHTKAQKTTVDIQKTLDDLAETSKMLLDNSGKEIEKRNMKTYKRARALNKLAHLFLERIRKTKAPDKTSYSSFHDFIQETQKAFLVIEVDVRNWFPRISPFFILDRRRFLLVFEKSKATLKEAQDFLTKEYSKTKTLEETFQLIDKLADFEQELAKTDKQKAMIRKEKSSLEDEVAEKRQKLADLKNAACMSQLSQAVEEIEALELQVKQSLRHLEKPFIKLQSLASRGSGSGLTPEECDKLNQYLQNVFEAFSTEDDGYPLLRQTALKLNRLISEGKLQVKADKARKAQQTIDDLINNDSLVSLHKKCREATSRKFQLSTSQGVAETQANLTKLRENIEDLDKKKDMLEREESSIQSTHTETLAKIRLHKNKIEEKVFSFLNKKLQIR